MGPGSTLAATGRPLATGVSEDGCGGVDDVVVVVGDEHDPPLVEGGAGMRYPDPGRGSHGEVGGIIGPYEGVLVAQFDDGERSTSACGERVDD